MHRFLLSASLFATILLLPAPAQEPPNDAQRLATACNAFAADLHEKLALAGPPVCSPGSIAIALLMLLPGAEGETADEIATVLHLPDDLRGQALHRAAKELLQRTGLSRGGASGDAATPLVITNDLWVQQGLELAETYTKLLRDSFAAASHELDFAADPEAARAILNAAVAEATNQRIRELLQPSLVTSQTRVVLTNALWFQAGWSHAFAASATADLPFTLAGGESVAVPTMRQTEHFGYGESDAWQALALPFAIGDVQFEVVVPRDGHDLAEAERGLLRRAYGTLREQRVAVELPRFTVRAAHRLRDPLQALGMRAAFDPVRADFSAMDPHDRIVVDDVVHETWIRVDEAGCEAAAATAVVLKLRGAVVQGPPKQFRADRPFAFGLRDRQTGLLLFVGRVHDPRAAQDGSMPHGAGGEPRER